jgi:hypothetical protein
MLFNVDSPLKGTARQSSLGDLVKVHGRQREGPSSRVLYSEKLRWLEMLQDSSMTPMDLHDLDDIQSFANWRVVCNVDNRDQAFEART